MIRVILYGLFAAFIFLLDRFSKAYALSHWREEFVINPYLYFQVTINRGISWGMFNYGHAWIFWAITAAIAAITLGLIGYAYERYKKGKSILGEVCVIAGSCSNIVDRLFFSGVIDFIVVHKDFWIWPVFNIADSFIVIGVGIMFFHLLIEHD